MKIKVVGRQGRQTEERGPGGLGKDDKHHGLIRLSKQLELQRDPGPRWGGDLGVTAEGPLLPSTEPVPEPLIPCDVMVWRKQATLSLPRLCCTLGAGVCHVAQSWPSLARSFGLLSLMCVAFPGAERNYQASIVVGSGL